MGQMLEREPHVIHLGYRVDEVPVKVNTLADKIYRPKRVVRKN